MITGAQCRAGRAFLDWSQEVLAEKAQVSRHTVRLFEDGGKTYAGTIESIEAALVAGGLEFLNTKRGPAVVLVGI